jgi:hypothetical protein
VRKVASLLAQALSACKRKDAGNNSRRKNISCYADQRQR